MLRLSVAWRRRRRVGGEGEVQGERAELFGHFESRMRCDYQLDADDSGLIAG